MSKKRADGRYARSFRLADGTRKYVYGRTRQEAERKLIEAKQQAERGQLVKADRQRTGDFLEYWLSVKKPGLRASTYVQYQSRIRSRIIPLLGKYQLQKLTMAHMQRFVSDLVAADLAPATVRKIYTILKTALADAVDWGMIAVSPCRRGVKLPCEDEREKAVLDEEQARLLLDAARGTDLEALVTVALATGMRYGELCALKWSDIDFERGVLRVQRSLTFVNGEGYSETAPKTRSSRRSIVLAGFALDALRVHRSAQRKARLAAPVWEDRDLIFCNAKGGYLSHMTFSRHFKKLLASAELPAMRFHDVRHSCATLLFRMRVPAKVVQEILGHSTIKTTMDEYGHVLAGMQDEAINDLDRLLSSGERKNAAN